MTNKGKHWKLSDESRKNISEGHKGMNTWTKGTKHSEETKIKMGLSHRNHPCYEDPERGRKISKSRILKKERLGYLNSAETRKKMALAKKGNNNHFGKFHSEETKRKISSTKQGLELKDWEKFTSFEPYTKEFNQRFKNLIRKRDNQICMLCLVHREKLNRTLDIHHVNYNKKLSIPENCISLCRSCHVKTNVNKIHWLKFFQSLLSTKYDYKYNEEGLPIINLEVKNGVS